MSSGLTQFPNSAGLIVDILCSHVAEQSDNLSRKYLSLVTGLIGLWPVRHHPRVLSSNKIRERQENTYLMNLAIPAPGNQLLVSNVFLEASRPCRTRCGRLWKFYRRFRVVRYVHIRLYNMGKGRVGARDAGPYLYSWRLVPWRSRYWCASCTHPQKNWPNNQARVRIIACYTNDLPSWLDNHKYKTCSLGVGRSPAFRAHILSYIIAMYWYPKRGERRKGNSSQNSSTVSDVPSL